MMPMFGVGDFLFEALLQEEAEHLLCQVSTISLRPLLVETEGNAFSPFWILREGKELFAKSQSGQKFFRLKNKQVAAIRWHRLANL